MIRNNNILKTLLLFGLITSGCLDDSPIIEGTYVSSYNQHSFSKEQTQTFVFYVDGTWVYQSPTGQNSGIYQIHGKDIVLTGQLMAARFIIQNDNTLIDSSNQKVWKRHT